jgi:hypothetical protein
VGLRDRMVARALGLSALPAAGWPAAGDPTPCRHSRNVRGGSGV